MESEEGRMWDDGHKGSLTLGSHGPSAGDCKNAPKLSVQMEITMKKMTGNRDYLFLLSQKNRWKQWYKSGTLLFVSMPLVPAMPVAS